MSALLRLAQRALGAPSQVRPRLGGLFERDTSGEADDAGAASVSAQVSGLRLRDQVAPPSPSSEIASRQIPPLETAAFTAPLARTAGDPTAPAPSAETVRQAGPDPQAAEAARPVFAPLIERTIHDTPRAERDEAPGAPPAVAAPYRPLLPERSERPAPAAPLGGRAKTTAAGPADIQISIGRIEVRGEPEPRRPSPAPRRGPQLMSLEDYLAKGRRR